MKAAWLCLAAMLSACSPPARETMPQPEKTTAKIAEEAFARPPEAVKRVHVETPLTLAPDGLLIADRAGEMQLVPYGTARSKAESAVEVVAGPAAKRGSSSECGAGTVDYTGFRDGLQMTFQDDKFAGWTINAATSPLRTGKGIGVGSTRQQLDAAYKVAVEDSSLGLLFSSGNLTGLLDIDGIDGLVTDIWAGTVCLID